MYRQMFLIHSCVFLFTDSHFLIFIVWSIKSSYASCRLDLAHNITRTAIPDKHVNWRSRFFAKIVKLEFTNRVFYVKFAFSRFINLFRVFFECALCNRALFLHGIEIHIRFYVQSLWRNLFFRIFVISIDDVQLLYEPSRRLLGWQFTADLKYGGCLS